MKQVQTRDFIYLTLLFTLMFIITACGKDGFKKTEYNINGEWLQCSQPSTESCGATLICDDAVYTCMTNVQMRVAQ